MNKDDTRNSRRGIFQTQKMFKNLPFLYYLSFLALLYIANSHYAERKARKIDRLKHDLNELRWHYNAIKSETMYSSTFSQLKREMGALNDKKTLPRKLGE
jgi:hypothetical protein